MATSTESPYDSLTSKQIDTLKQFRENVTDILKPDQDDIYLVKWLKARNFDLQKGEQMFRKSMEWRQEYGADDILDTWTPPEALTKYWPGGIYGYDKDGYPILWQLSKDFDARGMMKCVKKSDIVKYYIYKQELMVRTCKEQSKKLGKRIDSAVHISDLEGVNLGMVFTPGISDAMKQVFALYEANYPENLHKSFVINVPVFFAVVYNLLRPFLGEATKKKIQILSTGSWRHKIREFIDDDQLPVYWGGTATDPDGSCRSHITIGSKIPTSYYLRDQLAIDRNKLTCITVSRGSNFELRYDVDYTGTVIRWLFETEEYDISYGIDYIPFAEKEGQSPPTEVITPITRVNSHLVPEDGTMSCSRRGTYIFYFDNRHSWITNKQLLYSITVHLPDKNINSNGVL